MAVGAPPQLTRGVMAAAGQILEKGGIPALIRTIRRDPRAAAKLVAKAAKAGGMAAANPFGAELAAQPSVYRVTQDGVSFPAVPVMAMAGVPGLISLGQLEVTAAPTPGQFYRVKKGDNLLKIAERAWGDRGTRLMHARWINAVQANRPFHRASKDGFEAKQFGPSIIALLPRYADDPLAASKGAPGSRYPVLWIPEAAGDEPPEVTPPGPGDELPDVPDDDDDDDDTPPDVVPPLPPGEPDLDLASSPTPGQWYRIAKGDNLLTVAQKAYGSRSKRLMHSKWINAAQANAPFQAPTKTDFDRRQYGASRITFLPRFASSPELAAKGAPGGSYAVIWIPEAPGDEPDDEPPTDDAIPDDAGDDDADDDADDVTPPGDTDDDADDDADDVTPPDDDDDDDTGVPGVCPPGFSWEASTKTCIPKKPTMCPPGQVWDAGARECVAITPPKDDVDPDGEIEPGDSCPDGFVWDNQMQQCIPKKPTMCPPGQVWDAGARVCVPVTPPDDDIDPDGEIDPGGEPSKGPMPLPMKVGLALLALSQL